MTKLTFYRQGRKDGGIRTGVEINGDPVLGRFEKGDGEEDSVLEWYVDIRCSVGKLGNASEDARHWLLKHGGIIKTALGSLADELKTGMDFSSTLSRQVAGTPKGVRIEIVCSAVRRATACEMATVLSDLSVRWPELVRSLPELDLMAA